MSKAHYRNIIIWTTEKRFPLRSVMPQTRTAAEHVGVYLYFEVVFMVQYNHDTDC